MLYINYQGLASPQLPNTTAFECLPLTVLPISRKGHAQSTQSVSSIHYPGTIPRVFISRPLYLSPSTLLAFALCAAPAMSWFSNPEEQSLVALLETRSTEEERESQLESVCAGTSFDDKLVILT